MPRQKKQHLKRRPDGRYACRYKNFWFYGSTEDEALAARDDFKRSESLNGSGYRNIRSFAEYAPEWLTAYKAHLTNAPYNTHARILTRFLDEIGDKPLAQYTPTDISRFYQLYAGMSSSSIHSARDTIKGIFRAALADGLIDRNPAENVTPPKGIKGTHRAITPEERLLIHQTQHRLRPAVMLMLYAGLRRGEAIALDVGRDVDFLHGAIIVREAVRFGSDGQPVICRPKTEAGIRRVPLLDILAAELRPISGLACTSASGCMMSESAWKRAWNSYINALGEQKNGCQKRWSKGAWETVSIRAHDLRHSYCTMLYDAGVDVKTAMLWMGHADQSMTMQIYTHLSDQRRQDAENALRSAVKAAFGSQFGSQSSGQSVEPLPLLPPESPAQ